MTSPTSPRLFHHYLQTSYVVADMETIALGWTRSMGIGPWFMAKSMEVSKYRYRGRDCAPISLGVAMTYVGSTQLELIMPLPTNGPNLFDEFVQEGRMPALHHIAFMEPDYDAAYAAALERGLTLAHEGDINNRGRLAYFDHPSVPGSYIELCEASPSRVQIFKAMERICASWDGQAPLRWKWPTE